jgi:hypothetical protein
MVKSKRFSTCPVIRSALRSVEGPAVASCFADLGVAQTPVARPAAALNDKRLKGGIEKLDRTSTLAASLARRARFTAASGVPSATYGTSATPVAAARLRSLNAAAYASCWRSSNRSAAELVRDLFLPWRAHPEAVILVKTVLGIQDALRRGSVTLACLDWMWHGPVNATGPVRALQDALKRAGLALLVEDPGYLSNARARCSLTAPAAQLRDFVLQALQDRQRRTLSCRRPVFAPIAEGVDRFLTLRFERSKAPESRKAALRVVMTGGTITQSVASKWVRGGSRCPFCLLANEDPLHRFWQCPAWDAVRGQALQGWTRRGLERILGTFAVLTGIVPSNPALVEAQRTAEAAGAWPPVLCLDRRQLHRARRPLPATCYLVRHGLPRVGLLGPRRGTGSRTTDYRSCRAVCNCLGFSLPWVRLRRY